MAGRFLATALGGALKVVMSEDEVAELWEATDENLREREDDGQIVLWARAVDHPGRLAPLYFRPLDDD
jgi:hypothetical protein